MLKWRNWRLKYVGVQDRALKLCPEVKPQLNKHTLVFPVAPVVELLIISFGESVKWEIIIIAK